MKRGSYGLKEVADVILIDLTDNANTMYEGAVLAVSGTGTVYDDLTYTLTKGTAVMTLSKADFTATTALPTGVYVFDSLKVSNLEMASEDVSARGGKGNPELVIWSYGKELTFTMEDALLTEKTMEMIFGRKRGEAGKTITINANDFNKTYAMIGMTVRRSYGTGKDTPYVFYIPKVFVGVNGTLTMEAEGDPSTFEMTCRAMAQDLGTTDVEKDVLIQFIEPKGT